MKVVSSLSGHTNAVLLYLKKVLKVGIYSGARYVD